MTVVEGARTWGRPDLEWRLLVLRPIVLLVWLNVGAATACYGLALYWFLTGWWYSLLQWQLLLMAMGGFLSAVAFVGQWLNHKGS